MGTDERSTHIRVLIANDHPVICQGLRFMLSEASDIELVGCATSVPEMMRMVGDWQPGVLLVDPHMQGQDGFRAIEMIRGEWPHVAIIILTVQRNEDVHAPASGCYQKRILQLLKNEGWSNRQRAKPTGNMGRRNPNKAQEPVW